MGAAREIAGEPFANRRLAPAPAGDQQDDRTQRRADEGKVFLGQTMDLTRMREADIARAGIYLGQGYFNMDHWFYLPLLGLAGWCGAWVGRKFLTYIPQKNFENLVQVVVLLSGFALLWEALLMQSN